MPLRTTTLALLIFGSTACGGISTRAAASWPGSSRTPAGPTLSYEQFRPVDFQWPGHFEATAPVHGQIQAIYIFDNPCRRTLESARSELRGDTIALVIRWRPAGDEIGCPGEIRPDGLRIRLNSVPPGPYLVGLYSVVGPERPSTLTDSARVIIR